MTKYILFLFSLFSATLSAQTMCLTPKDKAWALERARLMADYNKMELRVPHKERTVRINYHLILRSNGTGNFTETGDNFGNSLTGYQFLKDITNAMNYSLSYNSPMQIPPGNTIPNDPPNYKYVIDAIYFHRNDNWFDFNSGWNVYDLVGSDKTSVMNIILTQGDINRPIYGYASTTSHNPTDGRFTENANVYQRYEEFIRRVHPGDHYSWVLNSYAQIAHELGHLQGLDHTVMYNGPPDPCPTLSHGGRVDTVCDDGCDDTPSAWFITDVLQHGSPAPVHPAACGWGWRNDQWCSNNMMDYSGHNALTPCQLRIIHGGLNNGLKNFTTCEAVKTDQTICDLGFPKLAYFGKKINIGCSGNVATLNGQEEANIYFSNEVVFNPTEISDKATLEVFFQEACN
jgi:hypothetical protein